MSKPTLKNALELIAQLESRIARLENSLTDDTALLKRIDRIEKALIKAKLIRLEGQDITDALWQPQANGKKVWMVSFEYFCPACQETHQACVDIPANTLDGAEHSVKGFCGTVSRMKIWKKSPSSTIFHPFGGPDGSPLVQGGL